MGPFPVTNNAPYSASAADDTTNFNILHTINTSPLSDIDLLFLVRCQNNTSAILPFALDSDKYYASECTFDIIFDTWNLTLAFGSIAK